MSFSSAPARGAEDSAEDQRVGPGSYLIKTTLTPIHPTITTSWAAKMPMEERMRVPKSTGDGSDPDPEKITYAIKRIISTSKKPPLFKFGKMERPDYGSMSATQNTRFVQPNGQVGEDQPESYRRSAPKYSLSGRCKLSGDQVQAGIGTPGPEYTLPEVIGTAPTSVFGASSRDAGEGGGGDTPGKITNGRLFSLF